MQPLPAASGRRRPGRSFAGNPLANAGRSPFARPHWHWQAASGPPDRRFHGLLRFPQERPRARALAGGSKLGVRLERQKSHRPRGRPGPASRAKPAGARACSSSSMLRVPAMVARCRWLAGHICRLLPLPDTRARVAAVAPRELAWETPGAPPCTATGTLFFFLYFGAGTVDSIQAVRQQLLLRKPTTTLEREKYISPKASDKY